MATSTGFQLQRAPSRLMHVTVQGLKCAVLSEQTWDKDPARLQKVSSITHPLSKTAKLDNDRISNELQLLYRDLKSTLDAGIAKHINNAIIRGRLESYMEMLHKPQPPQHNPTVSDAASEEAQDINDGRQTSELKVYTDDTGRPQEPVSSESRRSISGAAPDPPAPLQRKGSETPMVPSSTGPKDEKAASDMLFTEPMTYTPAAPH
ncbi:hypothetical protein DOTSEDRAFT_36423 [Dothistroma septosporum NZE10]|uniref:Uncharacterized protein n=1 Tax=Dothistroma septosporum (strain NZE10 / CBS 128990) TaxID=675120 RepID=N1PKE5_DOTSN|nr:hypothetical protein DOTSEDRAFT_36423 [Dothistroma septosporum NZE10]